jgi:hypothetical protein
MTSVRWRSLSTITSAPFGMTYCGSVCPSEHLELILAADAREHGLDRGVGEDDMDLSRALRPEHAPRALLGIDRHEVELLPQAPEAELEWRREARRRAARRREDGGGVAASGLRRVGQG